MARYRRRRDDEDHDRSPARARHPVAAAATADRSPGEPAATVLRLQVDAGNRAVTGLLAGSGPTVLREAVDRPAGGGVAAQAERAASATLLIPDLEETIPVHGVAIGDLRPGGGTSGERGRRKAEPTSVHLVVGSGPTTPILLQAAARGRVFATMVITTGYGRYVLADVLVVTVHPGDERTTVTLNAQQVAYVAV
jgi:hypothetical protein